MPLRQRAERSPLAEAIPGDLLILLGQSLNRQPQVIDLVKAWPQISRLGQCDSLLCRLASGLLDPLVHRVHRSPCEVRLGVWQPLAVVRAGSLADGQQALGLQVVNVQGLLPRRTVLHKVPSKNFCQVKVLNREGLSGF
jgi:hypothetical protein